MTVQVEEETGGNVLVVTLSGRLAKEDYDKFVPEADRLIGQHGKIRILVNMRDFHGWGAGALWEDLKFGLKHFKDIERLAMVGEKKWQKAMSWFCKPFTKAEVRYFERDKLDDAKAWVAQSPTT